MLALSLMVTFLVPVAAYAETLRLAVTTSFHNSGLAEVLLPEIKKDINLEVHLLVVGTGQALKLGRAGDVDAILVHSKKAEEKFVAEGYGTHRREIMYNDFIFVGPKNDPAKVIGQKTTSSTLSAIAKARAIFVSRGDDSGTNRKEIALWKKAGLDPKTFDASWYKASGSGMGATLNTASGMDGYALADRASWLNFGNKGNLTIAFSGDPSLFNQYGFLPVDPKRHPHVNHKAAKALENWLISDKAQRIIADYKIAGEQLFVPNAK
jgi:tungstate transport system substrate-binding protein